MSTAKIFIRNHGETCSEQEELLCELNNFSFVVHNDLVTSSGQIVVGSKHLNSLATKVYIEAKSFHRHIDHVLPNTGFDFGQPLEEIEVTCDGGSRVLKKDIDYKIFHFGVWFTVSGLEYKDVDIRCHGSDIEYAVMGIGLGGFQRESYDIDVIIKAKTNGFHSEMMLPKPFLYKNPDGDRLYIRSHPLRGG